MTDEPRDERPAGGSPEPRGGAEGGGSESQAPGGRGRGRRGRRGRGRGGERRDERRDERGGDQAAAGRGGERREERADDSLVVYLARSGVGSRRRCDELVRGGHVTVDGAVVTFPREKLAEGAAVALDGEVVTPRESRYVLVNKPRGVASTRYDPHADKVLVDLVPDGRVLFPVGRLDLDTTGLIILTNDGVLANRLMHPRYGVSKTYVARVRGQAGKRALAELRDGIELEDGRTSPAEVRIEKQAGKTAVIELTIHEGRKRQVRRMLAAVGLPVDELHRRRYGPITDKNLKVGAWRTLSGDEVEALRRAAEEVERNLQGDDPGEPVDLAAREGEPSPAPGDAPADVGTAMAADDGPGTAADATPDAPAGTDPDDVAADDAEPDGAADDAEPDAAAHDAEPDAAAHDAEPDAAADDTASDVAPDTGPDAATPDASEPDPA